MLPVCSKFSQLCFCQCQILYELVTAGKVLPISGQFKFYHINQSIKLPYPNYDRGQPYKRTFDMPTCLVPCGLGPVLICFTTVGTSVHCLRCPPCLLRPGIIPNTSFSSEVRRGIWPFYHIAHLESTSELCLFTIQLSWAYNDDYGYFTDGDEHCHC